jgi:transcriptional regulator with XRE-family HTH domain
MAPGRPNALALRRRKAFGLRVRQLRAEAGLTQEGLAEVARMDRTYVGDVERGERNVSLDNIWRLADALDIDPASLFH